jgi:GNAT superfamily N-acetyltransferase
MRIGQFNAGTDPEQLRSCFEIVAAAQPLDDPRLPVRPLTSFRNRWTSGFGGHPRQTSPGVDGADEAVGRCLLTLSELENPTLGWRVLAVAPARLRVGAGRAMLEHCIGQARLAGRVQLASEAKDGSAGYRRRRSGGRYERHRRGDQATRHRPWPARTASRLPRGRWAPRGGT